MSTYRLNNLLKRNENSFDFLRFAAALLVIFYHSFPLSLGNAYQSLDPVDAISHSLISSGTLAWAVFFITSGFLITASMERSKAWSSFIKSRVLRIYPGLIVATLLTVFILGPLVTSLNLKNYLTNAETYAYLKVLLLYKTNYFLPGVFEHNVYVPNAVNGSLWTLFFEFCFYAMVLALWLSRLLLKRAVLALFIGVAATRSFFLGAYLQIGMHNALFDFAYKIYANENVLIGTRLLLFFMSGMLFYLYRDSIKMKRRYLLLSIPFLLLSTLSQSLFIIWIVSFGSYILLYVAGSPRSLFKRFGKYGDFSYGMYIYAFPIQQMVVQLFGGTMLPIVNFVLSSVIVIPLGALSWYFVEKPALKLKMHIAFRRNAEIFDTHNPGLDVEKEGGDHRG